MLKSHQFKYFTFIAMVYVSTILISNVMATKLVQIGFFELPAAIIAYPLTFILDDVLAEVYGYKYTKPVIWVSLFCSFVQIVFFEIAIALPAIAQWHNEAAYRTTLGSVPRIVLASFLAIGCAQFTNAYVIAKLKIFFQGKHLWFRLLGSTLLSVTIDSVIFINLAFYGTVPVKVILIMIASQIGFKFIYEVVLLPAAMPFIRWLKRAEDIDFYDHGTNFNPLGRSK